MFDALEAQLREFLRTPQAKAIIAAADTADDDEGLARRAAVLDQLDQQEKTEAQLRAVATKARADFDVANAKWVEERGRLGAAEGRLNQAVGRAHELRRKLRTELGEQVVVDAERRLASLLAYLPDRIDGLEFVPPLRRGQPGLTAEDQASRAAEAAEAKKQLAAAKVAMAGVVKLRNARLAPREIAAQVRRLLDTAGIDE